MKKSKYKSGKTPSIKKKFIKKRVCFLQFQKRNARRKAGYTPEQIVTITKSTKTTRIKETEDND